MKTTDKLCVGDLLIRISERLNYGDRRYPYLILGIDKPHFLHARGKILKVTALSETRGIMKVTNFHIAAIPLQEYWFIFRKGQKLRYEHN